LTIPQVDHALDDPGGVLGRGVLGDQARGVIPESSELFAADPGAGAGLTDGGPELLESLAEVLVAGWVGRVQLAHVAPDVDPAVAREITDHAIEIELVAVEVVVHGGDGRAEG
jgi:hypothetical protein